MKNSLNKVQIIKFFKKFQVEIIVFLLYLLYLLFIRFITPIYQDIRPRQNLSPTTNFYNDWDFYYLMGDDILSIFKQEVIAPFCYRPLMPFLAGLLPFELETNFAIITFLVFYLTGILIYFTIKLQFNTFYSAMGLLLFCFLNFRRSIITYHFLTIYLVDPMAFLFLMCCFYCIFTSKKKMYLVFLILGVLTKEVVLFTIPVFLFQLIFLEKGGETKKKLKEIIQKLIKNSIFIIPGVLAYALIRFIITEPSVTNFYIWNTLYQGNEYFSIENIIITAVTHLNYYFRNLFIIPEIACWGFICLGLCLLNNSETFIRWIKIYGVYMIIAYFQLFLSYGERVNGASRVTYIGFFPIIILTILGLKNLIEFYPSLYQFYEDHQTYFPFRIIKDMVNLIEKHFLKNISTNIRRKYSLVLISTIEYYNRGRKEHILL